MTVDTQPGEVTTVDPDAWQVSSLALDELERTVSSLCARFPDCDRDVVERTVTEAYSSLARHASIKTHLIPLTMNRCRRQLHLLYPGLNRVAGDPADQATASR